MPASLNCRWLIALGAAACLASARADEPALLKAAVEAWTSNQTDWAFVRRETTTNDKGVVKADRVEAYDPSLPDDRRWRLISVDGHAPSPEDEAKEAKKNRKPRKYGTQPPAALLDFARATVEDDAPDRVVYEVPVKSLGSALAQTDKLVVRLTVNKATRTVERLAAQLRGPMRLALGLAKITDIDLDLNFEPEGGETTPTGGTARATLSTFGQHMTYEWWDFRAVRARDAAR